MLLTALPAYAAGTSELDASKPKVASSVVYSDESGASNVLKPQDNRLTAVHFWATWCTPCVAELPKVDAAQGAYGDKGFKVVALSLDGVKNMAKVKQFLADHKITRLAAYIDADNMSFKDAASRGLPTTLFIDSKGQEIARVEGPLDWKSAKTKAFIQKALK